MPWTKNFDIDETLDKAMHCFWSHGYEATSIQDLVRHMHINRGSLYGTFGDKRSLFIAALHRYDDQWRQSRLIALEQAHAPVEAIHRLFQDWIEHALNDPDHSGCFLTNTALELASHDSEIGEIVAASQRGIEAFFHQSIDKGQSRGEIPVDIDAGRVAQLLLAALIGLLVLARSRPERALLESIAAQALAALEPVIIPNKPGPMA